MQSIRRDQTLTLENNLKQCLPQGEAILHVIEVIPLDSRVSDFLSPKLYISKSKVLFLFDEVIDIYDLNNLEINLLGDAPNFEIPKILLEPTFSYSFEDRSQLERFKNMDNLTRISINEVGQVPSYFLIRKNGRSQKSMRTWAVAQLLKNIKMGNMDNSEVLEILAGYFSTFNTKTTIYFIATFLGYIVLKLLTSSLPSFISLILDILFGIVLVFAAYWAYLSVSNNLKRYKNIYLSFVGPI